MLVLIVAAFPAQQPAFNAMEYVRVHRAADAALVAGELSDARAGFEHCLTDSPKNATVAYALACVEARAANAVKALDWLERAVDWGYADSEVAPWGEDLAGLRKDARFVGAIERMRELRSKRSSKSKLVHIYEGGKAFWANDVAVHPSGMGVAVALASGVVQLLDSRTGHALRTSPPIGSSVWAVEFDNKGEQVVALTWDGKLHFWRIADETEFKSVLALGPPGKPELGWPMGAFLQFDPSGQRLLVAGRDRGASLWTARGERICKWSEPFGYFFEVILAWKPDGERIAIPKGRKVHFVDGRTGETVGPPLDTPSRIWSIAYQPGGHLLATGHDDGHLRVWDVNTRELTFDHPCPEAIIMFGGETISVNAVAFSPDGLLVAAGTGEDAYVDVVSVATHVLEQRFDWSGGHWAEPYELHWSIDSKRLWFAFACGSMPVDDIVLDMKMPKPLEFEGRSPRVGKTGLAVANGEWQVLALDARTGQCLWDRPNLSPDGEILQTSTGHFITDRASLDDVSVRFNENDEAKHLLIDFAAILFDPKRVRAAREGVAIVPVKF